jgi:hypothetical protein
MSTASLINNFDLAGTLVKSEGRRYEEHFGTTG